MYYHKVNFDFSHDAKNWLLSKYSNRWDENFHHDAEFNDSAELNTSIVGTELKQYLSMFGLDSDYAGINIFVSNTKEQVKTNPHVDVLHGECLRSIKSRFNVMILGNPNDIMMWWGHFKYGNKDHELQVFNYKGIQYQSLGIPGSSIEERYKFLGNPTETKSKLLTPSAFVNTEVAHSLEISSGPRLIISVGFDKSIDEIESLTPEHSVLSSTE